MGFWDFIAPDFESFRATLLPVVPEAVLIGPVVLSDDDFLALAWANPGSGAGLALRTYYAASTFQVARPVADALWGQIQAQAAAGAFGDGGGFGGSFQWKAVPDMAQIIIPNVYRVAIEAESGGQAVTNVVGVRGSGSGLAQQAAQAVLTAWTQSGGPLGLLTNLYLMRGVRAMDLSSSNGAIADIPSSAVGGITTGAKATNGACALVKWNGGTRSRSSRGRLYFGPLVESQVEPDGRTISSANRSALQGRFDAFRTSLSSAGFTLCVISPTTQSAFDVSSVAVEGVIATQRRRIRS